jgi:hypothetical protein
MAWAIPAWKTFPIASGGTTRRWVQRTIISVTATAADVDWDIGDGAAGAMFTSAIADGTHGAKATALAAHLAALTAKQAHVECRTGGLQAFIRVVGATAGATEYNLTYDAASKMPELTFHAASGPTALVLVIDVDLLDAAKPVEPVSYGTI